MSLWCAHAIVGDPPSLRRSHEIYSTYVGVPSATRCGRPTSRKMIASIQRSGKVALEERGELRVRPDQVTGSGTGRRHRPEDRQRCLRRRG